MRPTPPFDRNLKLVHLPQADNLLQFVNDFRAKETQLMPVLTFNEYIPTSRIESAIKQYKQLKSKESPEELPNRFRLKELNIFLEVQRIKFEKQGDYIVVPSKTTRLLYPINPYITTTQKTVFLVKEKATGLFINRDGYGFSRKEQPPMLLHRLNNHPLFKNLAPKDKLDMLLHEDAFTKSAGFEFSDTDIELAKKAFESFLRKSAIYYIISKYETPH